MPYIGNTIRAADDYRLIDDISSSFNGSTTSFALQVAGSSPVPFPKSPQQVLISVNGVIQEPDPSGSSGFNLVGTNIVFSSAPTNGHAFFGIIYATADYLNAGGNFPAGSLGAPSITFIGDENTGLYRKGGGSIGFVADATEIANTDSNGLTLSSGNLILGDSGGTSDDRIVLGAGSDLFFYHNGTDSIIQNFTGELKIAANQLKLKNKDTDETYISCVDNGAVELYHDNNKKFETTSAGVLVTGSLTADGGNAITLGDNKKIVLGTGSDLQIYFDGSNSFIKEPNSVAGQLIIDGYNGTDIRQGATGEHMIRGIGGGAVELYHNGNKKLETVSGGATITGVCTATSFAGDGSSLSGITTDLVNDTSPQLGGNLDVNTKNIVFGDSAGATDDRLTFGASTDLSIYHDGSHSRIVDGGTGVLALQGSDVRIHNVDASESMIRAAANGAVQLYYDNSVKLETTSAGIDITGRVTTDDLTVENTSGNLSAMFTATNGLGTLEVGGSTGAFIDLKTPQTDDYDLRVDSSGTLTSVGNILLNVNNGENGIGIYSNAQVILYYDSASKLETGTTGVDILGTGSDAGGVSFIKFKSGNGSHRANIGKTSGSNGRLTIMNLDNDSIEFGTSNANKLELQDAGHLLPTANGSYDLGGSSNRWRNVYTSDLDLSNESKGGNDIDGTWGSYTIQEGVEDLFLINKRNGKKYKFNLTEVS